MVNAHASLGLIAAHSDGVDKVDAGAGEHPSPFSRDDHNPAPALVASLRRGEVLPSVRHLLPQLEIYHPSPGHDATIPRKATPEAMEHKTAPTKPDAHGGGARTTDYTDPNGAAIHKVFDSHGKVISSSQQNPDGSRTTDDTSPDGTISHNEFNSQGIQTRFSQKKPDGTLFDKEFDSNGNRISQDVRKPNGLSLHTEYDPTNGLKTEESIVGPDGTSQRYKYDKNGSLATLDEHFRDGMQSHTEFGPNGKRVTQELKSPNGTIHHYEFGSDGQAHEVHRWNS